MRRIARSLIVPIIVAVSVLILEEPIRDIGAGILGEHSSGTGVAFAHPSRIEGDTVVIKPGLPLFLEPNVPNPFSASTQIAYTLDRETKVTLRVFDAFYNDIRTLVDGEMQMPGRYVFQFKPMGEFGSGMYFYSLTTSAGTETRRMMMIR